MITITMMATGLIASVNTTNATVAKNCKHLVLETINIKFDRDGQTLQFLSTDSATLVRQVLPLGRFKIDFHGENSHTFSFNVRGEEIANALKLLVPSKYRGSIDIELPDDGETVSLSNGLGQRLTIPVTQGDYPVLDQCLNYLDGRQVISVSFAQETLSKMAAAMKKSGTEAVTMMMAKDVGDPYMKPVICKFQNELMDFPTFVAAPLRVY